MGKDIMKVKVRDMIYDSEKEVIEVIFNSKEHSTISKMSSDIKKYCVPPYFMQDHEIRQFLIEEDGEVDAT